MPTFLYPPFESRLSVTSIIPGFQDLPVFEPDLDILSEHHVVGFKGADIQSRPFSLLRSQVVKRMRAEKWKLIGITSATPAVGKSFLSANLAASLSRLSDKQVYLFDFDIRRASLARVFGLEGEAGLNNYLAGDDVGLRSVGRRVGEANFALFPCYPTKVDSAELLVGDRFHTLIQGMRALPDDSIVICDLPPAFANDDAMMIAQQLDAYILVIEQGATTKKHVLDTMRLLQPSPCLGTVFNRYEGGFGDPYGYGYSGQYDKYYAS